ncbi:MAG: hypothetical protein K8R40_05915 [Anaerolineaceae bacterium]|nr:hypothetical protein [Anaerolineaceae bacterium]
MTSNTNLKQHPSPSTEKPSLHLKEQLKTLISHPSTRIFIITFIFYATIGTICILVYDISDFEGLSRISQAFAAIFGRSHRLSTIGLVWPPLPVASDLPFVFLLQPFHMEILAGTLMSAAYAGFLMIQLNAILKHFEIETTWRVIWMLLFGMQPLILRNAAFGLSETPFISFILFSLNGYLVWREDGKTRGIILAGIGAWLALYCRYEALAWVAVMAVSITWNWLIQKTKASPEKLEADLLTYLVPPAYGIMFWVFLNWMIMGNPIYFLVGPDATSNTPDTAQALGINHLWYYAMNSIGGSLKLLFAEIQFIGPLLLVSSFLLLIIIIYKKRWRDLDFLIIGWSIIAFTMMIGFRGYLPAWSRYFIWLIPGGVIVMGAVHKAIHGKSLRLAINLILVGLLAYPIINQVSKKWSYVEEPMPQKILLILSIAGERQWFSYENVSMTKMQVIANYLNEQFKDTITLVDFSTSMSLGFLVDHPENLVMTTDNDFLDILRNPIGNIDQILVPYPSFDNIGRSQVLKYYPGMYEGFEPWTTLKHEFPSPQPWRLYKVKDPAKVEN